METAAAEVEVLTLLAAHKRYDSQQSRVHALVRGVAIILRLHTTVKEGAELTAVAMKVAVQLDLRAGKNDPHQLQ